MLTAATSIGAQLLSSERGYSSPHTDTVNQVAASASALKVADLTITTLIDGIACNSDSECMTALSSGQGKTATVNVSYNFTPILGDIMGLVMPTKLNATMAGRVQ